MKLVEALSKLSNIEKQIKYNNKLINKYSASISTERPIFDSEKDQKDEILALINENKQLYNQYLDLKDRVNLTNSTVFITIKNETRTINQFLFIVRNIGQLLLNTYESLNDENIEKKLSMYRGEGAHIIRYYDEKFKNNSIKELKDLMNSIHSSISLANNTIDVIDKYDTK
ncbi:MAG: hypothetical protein ACOC33_01845 [bacterium]